MRKLWFIMAAAGLATSTNAQERLPDRQPDRTFGPAWNGEGIRLLTPGGLLLASYDRDQDLVISPEEIIEGAKTSFRVADRDQSGSLTPIEQQEWAVRITDQNDPAANPLLFDHNLDRMITEEEFVKGMQKMAASFPNENGVIAFEVLTNPPNAQGRTDRDEDRTRPPEMEGRGRSFLVQRR